MRKVRIIKNKEIIFESPGNYVYSNKKYVELNFYNLRDADLSGANLRDADLSYADLRGANLCGADLRDADLSYAGLRGANLCGADLSGANLRGADLRDANLRGADLSYADLSYAGLRGANLCGADLSGANLRGANLSGADLSYADLSGANLRGADLDKNELIRKGEIIDKEIIVYKKCQGKIVELELQKGSIVFSINNYKCRTNKAKVISIDGNKSKGTSIESNHDSTFVYKVGEIVEVKNFDLMYNVECSTGIHFFFNREDAEKY